MEKTGELDSMLTELDSPAASSEPAQPNKKKLPEPDASYAMPGAPTSETFERERKPRQQLKRSNTWVKRVTGEDLVETADPDCVMASKSQMIASLPLLNMASNIVI